MHVHVRVAMHGILLLLNVLLNVVVLVMHCMLRIILLILVYVLVTIYGTLLAQLQLAQLQLQVIHTMVDVT